jgi:hypothetical protein
MKLKYTNFKHYASSAPEPTFVPTHMIRKHWSLIAIEMYHLFVSLIGIGIVVFKFKPMGIFYAAIFVLVSSAMFTCAILSIMDSYHHRLAYVVTNTLLVIICLFVAPFQLSLILVIICLAVIASILFIEKNKSYYAWCKSISNN